MLFALFAMFTFLAGTYFLVRAIQYKYYSLLILTALFFILTICFVARFAAETSV